VATLPPACQPVARGLEMLTAVMKVEPSDYSTIILPRQLCTISRRDQDRGSGTRGGMLGGDDAAALRG
jgi:hypothetical protein